VRLPGVTPPRRIGDRLHVDGGVLDNLPIGTMADDGEGPVLACDVAMPFDAPADIASVGVRRLPHIVDTIARSMTLASWSRGTGDRDRARTVITPALGGIGMFDFARVDDIVDAGRRAAEAALPVIRAAVSP
jgi:predicted acylesterase/phospholipase RssA